ncbi:MAG: hypothetical protein QXQ14_03545, partial [Candidatus Aenigmatarchaeota archaeon]
MQKVKTIIFGIGYKETDSKKIKYKFRQKIEEATSTIEAIKKIINSSKSICFYPKSLHDESKENIKIFQNFYDEIETIQAIGKIGDKEYYGDYEQITAHIFLKIAYEILENENLEEIIIDISRGHNIYISALLEAIFKIGIFYYFLNLNLERNISFKLVFSEPAIPREKIEKLEIFEKELRFQNSFKLPLEDEDINYINKLVSSVSRISNLINRKHIEDSIILFSSIKNSLPLVSLYILKENKEIKEETIKNIYKSFLEKLKNNDYKKIENIKADAIINACLLFSSFLGIKRFLAKENISFEDFSLENLENFEKIYEKIAEIPEINKRFFKRDIEELKFILSKLKLKNNERKKLDDIYKENITEQNIPKPRNTRSSDIVRNFFAHCGFERTVT